MSVQCLYLVNIFHSEMSFLPRISHSNTFCYMMFDACFIVPPIIVAIECGVYDGNMRNEFNILSSVCLQIKDIY